MAPRHRCGYLVHSQIKEFVRNGGDRSWLQGVSFAPPKLQLLLPINELLAHRPWLISKAHVKPLLTGASSDGSPARSEDLWTITELTHALVLMR
jgi:hypothetical protein